MRKPASLATPIGPSTVEPSSSMQISSPRVDLAPGASQPLALEKPITASIVQARSYFPRIFLSGAAFVVLWLGVGILLTRRIINRCSPAPSHLHRELIALTGGAQPRLGISKQLKQPAALGAWSPTIVLPAALVQQGNPEELRAALAHEWSHLSRGDLFLLGLGRLLSVLLYAHPLFWWLRHRAYLDQEYMADAAAAGRTGPIRYAEFLLRWSKENSGAPVFGLGASTSGRHLKRRLTKLLQDSPCQRSLPWSWLSIASVCSIAIALICSTVTFYPGRAAAADIASSSPVLTVALDGSAAYRTVQAAIEAAPAGALIRVAPGLYDEHLVIDKPVGVEGAGWNQTHLRISDEGRPINLAVIERELKRALESAASDAERETIRNRSQRPIEKLPHAIKNAGSVTLRGLRLSVLSTSPRESFSSVLVVTNTRVQLSECAIVGGPGNGLVLKRGAEADLNRVLVGGLWGTGIIVEAGASLRARESDIRNCYYAGVVIRAQSEAVIIERCLVSGAAWHGIRYDDCSPSILNNVLFGNARSGIYASGQTKAVVRGNLFFGNAMGGMSCWLQNEDVIEQNTFAGNAGVGVTSLGASRPDLRRNLFYRDEVRSGNIGSEGPFAKVTTGPRSTDNQFFTNDTKVAEADRYHFVEASKQNFALKADSPLRVEQIGATDFPTLPSAWPLQPEELAIVPEGSTRDWQAWKRTTAESDPAPKKTVAVLPTGKEGTLTPDNALQAMIDAAPVKAVIDVPPGVYTQPVTINKELTLRGSGQGMTRLEVTSDQPALSATHCLVHIENLAISWQRETSERPSTPSCALFLKDAKALVKGCRFTALGNNARSPAGLFASGFSDLQLTFSRVDGFEYAVQFWEGAQGAVNDCVILKSGHCGITVGTDSAVGIERSIVAGSEFHGIRSTGGTIKVRDNLIVANKNRGVYLGNRSARGEIINNLITDNTTGISAFDRSQVQIHHNVIRSSSFAGLDLRDTCPLDIDRNIFESNKTALIVFAAEGKQKAVLGRNTCWRNETNIKDITEPGELLALDPVFAAATAGDFAVTAPALQAGEQGLLRSEPFRKLWNDWQRIRSSLSP